MPVLLLVLRCVNLVRGGAESAMPSLSGHPQGVRFHQRQHVSVRVGLLVVCWQHQLHPQLQGFPLHCPSEWVCLHCCPSPCNIHPHLSPVLSCEPGPGDRELSVSQASVSGRPVWGGVVFSVLLSLPPLELW